MTDNAYTTKKRSMPSEIQAHYYSADEILEEIKKWVHSKNNKTKFYEDVVKHIELKLERQLTCLETTWSERQYVNIILEMWIRKSLKKAFEYLENKTTDISKDMSTLLYELDSITSFEDIRSKLADESRLRYWCDGGCQYLQLILDQKDLFKTTPRFVILVVGYFKHFKTSCTDKVFFRCLNDIAKGKAKGERLLKFISALDVFLTNVRENKELQDILEEENEVAGAGISGHELVKKLLGKIFSYYNDNTDSVLSSSNKKVVGAVFNKPKIPEWFDNFTSTALLKDADWTPKLQSLTIEMCKKFLLPKNEIKIKDDDGRQIIFIKGIVVFVSKIINCMFDVKRSNPDVQEIQIVGLTSVHIDWDLTSEDWHGMNVGIVSDKIVVTGEVCWDVSGLHGNIQLEQSISASGLDDEESGSKSRRVSGVDYGKPGESGGNVYVVCNEIINNGRWTIISDGGDGENASLRKKRLKTKDIIEEKWSKEKFEKLFPSMSRFDSGEKAVRTVLTTLKKILPSENRDHDADILPGHQDDFFIEGTTKDGSRITVSYYHKINKTTRKIKKRYTVILCQGKTVRQGGFGGTIAVENLSGETFEESTVPFTGKEKHQIRSVRTGFYEALGSDGKMSKAAGDIGFIHNVSSSQRKLNSEGKFIGFDSDNRLNFRFQTDKPHSKTRNSYAKLHHPIKGLNYVSIIASSNREFYEDNSLKLDQRRMVEAVKKKAITRQSLAQQLTQIGERKQMTQSLQKMLVNPSDLDQHCSIDVLINEMSTKEVQMNYQLTSQQRNYHQDKIGQKHVKEISERKTDVIRSAFFSRSQINVGRRPVDFWWKSSSNKVYCIDVLPTVSGVDSAIHSIFGQPNSSGSYFCNNTKKYRHRIAKFILDKDNQGKIFTFIEKFVLRVKNGSKNFPVASLTKDLYIKHRMKNGAVSEFNWRQPMDRFDKLLKEYAKFVESPSSNLILNELEILASVHDITVHVYQSQSSSFKFQGTFNRAGYNEYLIMYERCGEWQRLKANTSLQLFCNQFEPDLFICQPIHQKISYLNLIKWSEMNNCSRETIAALQMFNPEDGDTPDELSRLLLKHLKDDAIKDEKNSNKLVSDICLLSEWVVEYNSRNISPIFYMHIVAKCKPHEWKYEFLLLEIEERLTTPLKPAERKIWREDLLCNLDRKILSLLRQRLVTSTTGRLSFSLDLLEPEKFEKMLKMLAEESSLSVNMVKHLDQLSLNDWYFELKSKLIAMKNGDRTSLRDPSKEEEEGKRESSHLSLERNLSNIISLMNNKDWPYKYDKFLRDIEHCVNASALTELDDKSIQKLIKEWQTKGLKLNEESLIRFLYVYDYAVQKTFPSLPRKGSKRSQPFRLRDTQRVTIITLLRSTSTLAQVSTGEGKSLIVAGVAIAYALSGKKVDVIISNDVLALRDSNLSVADGGLRDMYEYFKVEVSNNCSQTEDDRVKAYDSAVVYGELTNFQRDYLLDTFYGRNIRGDRTFDLVIIDEVDCMLLDRGDNTLYLSHDIPGMEMLESLYVFIWEKIRNSSVGLEKIKSLVLYDLYGAITKEYLESVHAPLKDNPSEKNAIWEYLIEAKLIDPQGRFLVDTLEQLWEKKINYIENSDLNPKLIFSFRKVIERERRIRIPSHLLSFVDRHLDTWLENALVALYLKPDVDYVVDQDRTDTSTDLNPQVIIIDPHTGTDQTSSQWNGALHQFLQLKEGCKLTLQSLKAVFISNATYIKRYKMLLGASGTLGFKPETEFLQEKYGCRCIFIPTAFPKCFTIKTAKVLKTVQSWLEAIKEEVQLTVFPDNQEEERSVVIFCRSIKDVNIVHQYLTTALPKVRESGKIHRYTRDYEKFAFESKSLDVGHIIVATNLAGRGTDIKISKRLNKNGGLHVCLAYLPENERIEEQAMGRAGRNGAPGSGIIILLCEPPQCPKPQSLDEFDKWSAEKFLNMKEQRNIQERQRISSLKKDFFGIDLQEKFFNEFSKFNAKLNIELKNLKWDNRVIKAVCDSVLDKWALWLDETEDDATFLNFECINYFLKKELLDVLKIPNKSPSDIEWMTPARSIVMAKHLINNQERKTNFSAAAHIILDRLVQSNDSFFYPAAHYYLSFIFTTEDFYKDFQQNKIKFIRTLRTCESNLIKHIQMQSSFIDTIKKTITKSDQIPSFCVVNAYKQQKQNVIKLFEYFICSIRSLLGSHSCSPSDIEDALIAKDMEDEKVYELFESLMKSKCIISQVNDEETVPNRDAVIQRIADDNGVSQSSLNDCLDDIKGTNELKNKGETFLSRNRMKNKKSDGLSEKEIEKKFKSTQMIRHSRKEFWKYLLDEGVLQDAIECAIVLESEDSGIRHPGINIDIKFTDGIWVQYSYLCSFKDLEENKKMVFPKAYFKEQLLNGEYRHRKTKFEFNKIGRLDLAKLKSLDLTPFGQLKRNDLIYTKINNEEWSGIWNDLLKQQIIDEKGNLLPNKETQLFYYPKCPAYEIPVRKLIGRTFTVEIVRRQWLKVEENSDYLEAIEILPLKPYRDILSHLKISHVIYGAHMTEDTEILEKTIKDIMCSKNERQCILEFLKSRQPVYVTTKMTPDTFFLYSIEGDIRTWNVKANIFSELYAFIMVGFDHVINMKERKRTWKLIGLSSLVILSGLVQTATGAVIERLGLGKAVGDVSQQGMSDIFYAIKALKSREEFTWNEYKNQKRKNAMEKLDPMMIRDLLNCLEAKYEMKQVLVTSASYSMRDERTIGCQQPKKQFACKSTENSAINQFRMDEHKVDFFFQLQDIFDLFLNSLIEKTNNVILKKSVEMKDTLGKLHHLLGLKEAQQIVNEEMIEFVNNSFELGLQVASKVWGELSEKRFSKVDDIVISNQETVGLVSTFEIPNDNDNIFLNYLRKNFDFNMGISTITRTQVTCIIKFHEALKKIRSPQSESLTANYFDIEERHRFQKNVMTNIKSELARNAEKISEKMIEYLIHNHNEFKNKLTKSKIL